MLAFHEHFRLDDGNEAGFLAQRGIARQRVSVRLDATPAWMPSAMAITARHLAKRAPI